MLVDRRCLLVIVCCLLAAVRVACCAVRGARCALCEVRRLVRCVLVTGWCVLCGVSFVVDACCSVCVARWLFAAC